MDVTATERPTTYDPDLEPDHDADDADLRAVEGATGGASRGLSLLLAIGGAVGLVAAFTLTYDKFKILVDPSFEPSCDVNPLLSCGSVMAADQAEVFGFPNPLLGIVGFTIVLTLGVLLVSGVRLPGWVWGGLQLGTILGIVFVHWLMFQSLYEIGKLCPWCIVVWTVMIPIFVYTTLRNLRAVAPRNGAVRFLSDWHALVLSLWYVAVVALALIEFWDQWLAMVGIA